MMEMADMIGSWYNLAWPGWVRPRAGVPKGMSDPNGNSGDEDGGGQNGGGDTNVVTKTKPKTKKPSMYRVLLLNDDYTPMEFVVHVLERYFNKDEQEATQIMLHVHQKGIGVCGVFPFEIAETKVMQVTDLARKNQHPLQCTMEKI
tara:strand:- start:89 stop:526 length:438 start_codon:yes stop_codon:yes gene_type:complete